MNKINPLYIAILLIVILIVGVLKVNQQKEILIKSQNELKYTQKVLQNLVSLKEIYTNKKKIKKEIKRVLSSRILRASSIKVSYLNSSIKINSSSIDLNGLNYIMGKILNTSYNITSLKIKALSDTKASLDMEIKW